MSSSLDRLYELLPNVYRQRDAEKGYPLRSLLRVISEEVNVVEEDISQLYENWFIETCQDWVVPYIGDLIGYQPINEAGDPGDVTRQRDLQRNKILIPRREVAKTLHYRRRKGTLALLEVLAKDVAGWPARSVEFYRLLGFTQNMRHLRPARGKTADLRLGDALDLLDSPFDELAHTADVRQINSRYIQGRYNISNVGVFVWRIKPYEVTKSPAYLVEGTWYKYYTFSVLGNDVSLYTRPQREEDPTAIAGELNLPVPIRRRALEDHLEDYYGPGKSLQIWASWSANGTLEPIPADRIVAADLSIDESGSRSKKVMYQPSGAEVAIDPELGRLVFSPSKLPQSVSVYYNYGFGADIGGGEYYREFQPEDCDIYSVGEGEELKSLEMALNSWSVNKPKDAIIEITDSRVYGEREKIAIDLEEGQRLQIRAARGSRPVIRLLDLSTSASDPLSIVGKRKSRIILDGLMVTGRNIEVAGDLEEVVIRHCTFVPGWIPGEQFVPSLELFNMNGKVRIEHSILGPIQINQNDSPVDIYISDSILDALDPENEAFGTSDPDLPWAKAILTVLRSTVIGQIWVQSIELAENCILEGVVDVERRQRGCIRFCYLRPKEVELGADAEGVIEYSTPRRYRCQPDLAVENAKKELSKVLLKAGESSDEDMELAVQRAKYRVSPQFCSTQYGTPDYCQLTESCAEDIRRGADDESEMGVFHDLYQPQRAINLNTRLEEYTPAGMDVGIIYAKERANQPSGD